MIRCHHQELDHKYIEEHEDEDGNIVRGKWEYATKDALISYDKTYDKCKLCHQLIRKDR